MKQFVEIFKKPVKIRTKLFFTYFLLLVIFCSLTFTVLISVRSLIVNEIGKSRQDVLRQIAERTNIIKTSSITLANLYEYEITEYLDTSTGKEDFDAFLKNQSEKYNQIFEHIGFNAEVVFLPNETLAYSTLQIEKAEQLTKQLWYRKLIRSFPTSENGEIQFSRSFFNDFSQNRNFYQFAAAKKIDNGIMLIIVNESLLEQVYQSSIHKNGDIYIYDQDGYIVSHTNKKMLGKQFINIENMNKLYGINSYAVIEKLGNEYLLSTYLDEETGWTIVEEVPTSAIFNSLNKVYSILITIAVIALMGTFACAFYLSRRISNPLNELSTAMHEFNSENFTPLRYNRGTLELNQIRNSYNIMAREIVELIGDVKNNEMQKRVLEMNFLRAQINPHFLYNMLFSIRCTVEINKNKQAVEMITAFSALLRSTLNIKKEKITLSEEFESIRKYLVVQKLRYGEKVNFEFDLDEQTKDYLVLPLILQPIVENAIFHGLEAKKDASMIVISSYVLDDILYICVTDDGVGISLEKQQEIISNFNYSQTSSNDSIGLSNVHKRITLNYGNQYGITIQSECDFGTTVTIKMPVLNEKGDINESFDS